jgi:hypothetical protein
MLNYAEITTVRTIVPVTPLPQSQQLSTDYVSSVFSYIVGPIDPTQIITLYAQLSTGDAYSLLVPTQLPSSLLAHPTFKDGCEWGYLEGIPQEEQWTFLHVLNEVYARLREMRDDAEQDFLPWTLGFLLGELASLAVQDRTLALTGLAHYGFLLPLFTRKRPADWPHREPYHPYYRHRYVMKAYRQRIRMYKEQGKSFEEAQRLALAGSREQEREGM